MFTLGRASLLSSFAFFLSLLLVLMACATLAHAQERSVPAPPSYDVERPPLATDASLVAEHPSRAGRASFIGGQTVHGIALGLGLCVLADCRAHYYATVPFLTGTGALLLSLLTTSDNDFTPGLAHSINTGLLWGTWLSVATPAAIDDDFYDRAERIPAVIAMIGQLGGMGLGYLGYRLWHPTEGQVSLTSTAGFWTSAIGILSYLAVVDDASTEGALRTLVASGGVGLLLGGLLASHTPMSNGRVLLISTGGLLGGLLGLSLATLPMGDDFDGRIAAGVSAVGVAGGIALSYFLTRNWDLSELPDTQLGVAPVQGGAMISASTTF